MTPLLSIRNLRISFATENGLARAVDGVSWDVNIGETLVIVGESGSGKTVAALSILRLIQPPGRIERGSEVMFEGRDLAAIDERDLRAIRGRRIAMVFQDPTSALNPVFTIGEQIAEAVRVHEHASRDVAWARAVDMLRDVGIPEPELRASQYPHQLSGGTRQRALMAMALVLGPSLLIADEPTSGLDVTVQAQILRLLSDLQRRIGMAVVLITHDLGVAAEVATRVVVMYAGLVVEEAPVKELFGEPHHPYTSGLLGAIPRPVPGSGQPAPLVVIPGVVPPAAAWPIGCRFRERCPSAWDRCARENPPLYQLTPVHFSRCHLADEPSRQVASTPPRLATSHGA
jgi:oligopeptide/dipeptide ABC transporter ATP-binding protein